MVNLVALFASLRTPSSTPDQGARFSAIPIPDYDRHRLGKDEHAAPSLLIAIVDNPEQAWPAPTVLEHLIVQHDVICRVSRADSTIEEGRFTVVRCVGADRALQVYFLRIGAALIASLGPAPTSADVSRAVDALVALFRALTDAPRKSVQGLWAELLLIARSRDLSQVVSAWHVLPGDRYDFSAGSQRIEVKSASGRVRQHYFSLDQLRVVAGTQVLIASVLVERAGSGMSLIDLLEQVRSRISSNPDLLLHVDRIVSITLGDTWRLALEERFDRHLAEGSLAFYEPVAIPKVDMSLPVGVSEVRFKADLTGVTTADLSVYRPMDGLFRNALR